MAVKGIDLGKYKLGWHDSHRRLRLHAQEGPEREDVVQDISDTSPSPSG